MRKSSLVAIVAFATILWGCNKGEEQNAPQASSQVVVESGASSAEKSEILRLVELLSSSNSEEQAKAAEELCKFGPKAKAAIPSLLIAKQSKSAIVEIYAGNALVSIGPEAARAIVKSDGDNSSILSRMGESAVPIIMEELKKTSDMEKKLSFLMSLGMIGKKAVSALPELEEMFEREKNIAMRALLESTIVQIKEGPEGLDNLVKKNDKDLKDSRESLANLRNEAQTLAEKIASIEMTITSPEADALMKTFGDDFNTALPKLADMLGQAPEKRATALVCLGRIGKTSSENRAKVLPGLREELNDKEPAMRALAALFLIRLDEKEKAVPLLVDIVKNPSDPAGFMFAVGGLSEGKVIVEDIDALAMLKALLDKIDGQKIAGFAVNILINSHFYDGVLPAITKMLESGDPEQYLIGACLLAKMGPKGKPAIQALKEATARTTDKKLKSFMELTAIAINDVEQGDSSNTILANLASPDGLTRVQAFGKLEKLNSQEKREILPSLIKMLDTTSGPARDLLIHSICDFGPDAASAFPALKKLLEETLQGNDKQNQFVIAGTLGKFGNAEAAPLLVKVMKLGDENGFLAASISLKELGPKAKSVVPDLIKMMKDKEICDQMLLILKAIGPLEREEDAEAMAELLDMDMGISDGLIAFTLSDIGNPKAIPAFIKKLKSHKKMTRLLSVGALGEIGKAGNDPRIVPALKSARKTEKEERVTKEIDAVLQKLK